MSITWRIVSTSSTDAPRFVFEMDEQEARCVQASLDRVESRGCLGLLANLSDAINSALAERQRVDRQEAWIAEAERTLALVRVGGGLRDQLRQLYMKAQES